MPQPSLGARLGAEFLGTFLLVFGGCGSAVMAAVFLNDDNVQLGIGFVGVALAFGLTVLTGAYAFGHVSGGHFNPAVTIGLAVAKRIEWKSVGPYIGIQLVAASVAGAVLFVIASGKEGFNAVESGFASNGYGDRSPDGYNLVACLIIEIVLTAIFLYIILGATDDRAPKGFAPIAIGLGLTLIHLASIPVTNTSVNPARSIGVAWFAGGRRASPSSGSSSWPRSSAPRSPASATRSSPASTPRSMRASPTTRNTEDPNPPVRIAPPAWTRPEAGETSCSDCAPRLDDQASTTTLFRRASAGGRRGIQCAIRATRRSHIQSAEGGTRTLTPEGTGT